ncbi:uncharacterized protein LOC126993899 [Eriocheir sinensis]|uniref:uncharacterized protein LOC126993899 n=1 Tax=Eriocheir sinensis TaxID=95602 RepID=UPI0021C75DF1|nr:uncharacterized protein LOC126993899 [Eriocheir sinensis]XP_050709096.1 uncharacterized protein LOC126993899 [Eriocheir sinensis]
MTEERGKLNLVYERERERGRGREREGGGDDRERRANGAWFSLKMRWLAEVPPCQGGSGSVPPLLIQVPPSSSSSSSSSDLYALLKYSLSLPSFHPFPISFPDSFSPSIHPLFGSRFYLLHILTVFSYPFQFPPRSLLFPHYFPSPNTCPFSFSSSLPSFSALFSIPKYLPLFIFLIAPFFRIIFHPQIPAPFHFPHRSLFPHYFPSPNTCPFSFSSSFPFSALFSIPKYLAPLSPAHTLCLPILKSRPSFPSTDATGFLAPHGRGATPAEERKEGGGRRKGGSGDVCGSVCGGREQWNHPLV